MIAYKTLRISEPRLRTADAVGVHAIVILKDRAAPLTETAVSIARGAAEHVPVIQVRNLAETMAKVSECGIKLVGCSEHTETDLHEEDLKGPLAIVMGAEEKAYEDSPERPATHWCVFLCLDMWNA